MLDQPSDLFYSIQAHKHLILRLQERYLEVAKGKTGPHVFVTFPDWEEPSGQVKALLPTFGYQSAVSKAPRALVSRKQADVLLLLATIAESLP